LRANYDFYALRPKNERNLEQWINQNFKDVQGKIFRPYEKENLFILALEKTSEKVQNALHGKDRKPLEQEEVKQEQPAVETEKQPEVKSPKEQEAQDLRTKLERAFVVQPVDKLDAPLDVAIEEAAKVAVETKNDGAMVLGNNEYILLSSIDKNANPNNDDIIRGIAKTFVSGYHPNTSINLLSIKYFAAVDQHKVVGAYEVLSINVVYIDNAIRLKLELGTYHKLNHAVNYGIDKLAAKGVALNREEWAKLPKISP
jgi:hypothetical protein